MKDNTPQIESALTKDGVYYWNKGCSIQVNKYFKFNEFDCHCKNESCKEQQISKDLVDKLYDIRENLGQYLKITSGFRCKEYQDLLRLKGFETSKGTSQHELGRAADVSTKPTSHERLFKLCKEKFKALGKANTFIHVDLRDLNIYWEYK